MADSESVLSPVCVREVLSRKSLQAPNAIIWRGHKRATADILCGRVPLLVHSFYYDTPVLSFHLGHTPSTAGTFRKKFRKKSGKTPETLSELFPEFPSGVRLGSPKPYNSRHLRLPEHFQNCLPLSTAGTPLFSEVVPERASQSWPWSSQQS